MSNEQIVIQIDDKINPSIIEKLKNIAVLSLTAANSIDRLNDSNVKTALASEKLFQAEAKSYTALENLTTASNKALSSNETLIQAKLKNIAATKQVYEADNKRLISIEKLRVAEEQSAQAAIKTSIATQALSSAEIKAGIATEALAQAKLKTALASEALNKAEIQTKITAEILIQQQIKSKTALEGTALAQNKLTTEQNKAALVNQKLKTETEKTAIANANVAKSVSNAAASADRAALVHLRLEAAQKRAEKAASTLHETYFKLGKLLREAMAIAGVSFAIEEVLALGNAYLDLQNKLKVVTTSEAQLGEVSANIFDIANRTRSSVEATAKAFSRFDMALIQLGKSQSETLKMTETVNKALIVSGASAEEQSSALLQLSQAFNKGKLDGDEFRSVMELMPPVADAIAKQLGVTRGELLKLAPQGKITAEVMSKALSMAAIEIEAKFARTVPTLNQGLTVLKNKAIETFGEIEKQTGMLKNAGEQIAAFGRNLTFIAFDISVLLNSVGDLGSAFASLVSGTNNEISALLFLRRTVQGVGFIVSVFADTIKSLNVTLHQDDVKIYTNELEQATQRLVNYKNKLGEKTKTENDKSILKDLQEQVDFYTRLKSKAIENEKALANLELATEKWTKSVEQSEIAFKNLEEREKLLAPINKEIETLATSFVDLKNKIESAEKAGGKSKAIEIQKTQLEDLRKKYEEAREKRDILLGSENLRKPGAPAKTIVDTSGEESRARIIQKIIAELNKESTAFGMVAESRDIYLKMTEIEIQLDNKRIGKKKEHIKLSENERELISNLIKTNQNNKRTQSEIDKIYESTNGNLLNYNATIDASNILLKSKTITQEQYNRTLLIARETYLNSADPLRQLNKGLKDEAALLEFVGMSQQVESRMKGIRNDLLSKGIVLSQQQELAYKKEIFAISQKNLLNQEENKLYSESIGRGLQLAASYQALGNSLSKGVITQNQYDTGIAKLVVDMANLKISMDKATFSDVNISALGSLVSNYRGAVAELTNVWGDFFKSLEDGFAKSMAKGIVEGENLRDLLNDVAKNALEGLIEGLIKVGIQYVINAALGKSLAASALSTQTAMSVAAAATTAVAWAPAAALTSLASFGANAAPAMAGLEMTAGASELIAAMAGFETGGYTGNGGTKEIAGLVHGKEFVVNAPATAKNRPILEAMNKGENLGSVAAGPVISVKIENYGTSKEFEVTQDEGRIRIIARDEAKSLIRNDVPSLVASEIANPNSSVSKSLGNNTTASRRR